MSSSFEKVQLVSRGDGLYPKRVQMLLGDHAPSCLSMQGNLELLDYPSVGFCGSRKSSLKGLETAKDCAEQAARSGLCVVSGNAAGVDFEAHYHSLKAGGKTILVLPEGIGHFKIKKALHDVWDWGRVLVISQYEENDSWQVFRAMERNKLIIALSRAMIVIEAGERGGTLNAGRETLRMKVPLFVAEYQDMSVDARGNDVLLKMGGVRLARSRATSRANLENIVSLSREEDICISPQGCLFPQQGNLF